MSGLALGLVGLWVVLQTTYGPLATKLGLLTSSSSTPGTAGAGPTQSQGNPSGVSVWQPTPPPAGAPAGSYRVDQNGNYQVQSPSGWVPYTPGSGPAWPT